MVENAFHDTPDVVYQVAVDDLIARRQVSSSSEYNGQNKKYYGDQGVERQVGTDQVHFEDEEEVIPVDGFLLESDNIKGISSQQIYQNLSLPAQNVSIFLWILIHITGNT